MVKSKFNIPDLKDFLDEKSYQYESLEFIKDDPILIPHSFTKKEDIEISGFITSVISWGNRKSIINSAKKIIEFMDNSPFDFIAYIAVCYHDIYFQLIDGSSVY